MRAPILDAHTHCGYTVPYEELSREWEQGAIHGGVMFSPVEEIYDRYDPFFTDSEEYRTSRNAVHQYLLGLAERDHIFSYFFVWNDFLPIPDGFVGIKWHRHSGEPVYNYEEPACERAISEICDKGLPIVLEEEFRNTLQFIERIAERTVVIIPHLGALNGGYGRLKQAGVFESPFVWADTALAGYGEITDFAENYGTERLMFGSDYPFGVPALEKRKLERLFSEDDLESILGGNLLRLLGRQ
jgi:hypothetical protein